MGPAPIKRGILSVLRSRPSQWIRALSGDKRGASVVFIGLTLPVLIGALGLAAEVSYWQLHHRAMQNAADAAAIAAATNGGSGYASEAKAVAAQYGFSDGLNSIVVSATHANAAPGCTADCYVVTISDEVPLYLSEVVGYTGDTTVNNQPATTIAATAVATSKVSYAYCILALAGSGAQGITTNGAPKSDLNGCNVMSNTDATCNGHDLNANFGDAAGTNSGCGRIRHSVSSPITDPYSGIAANIPANSCSAYPQEPVAKTDPPLPATNQLFGFYSTSGVKVVCGDQMLTADTTINNTLLVIENGRLDTNGYKLSGSALTVVFAGANAANYQHTPTGNGTLDIAAPTSGAWSGIALYQAPTLTTNVDISAAGNSPTWNISGLVYLPHARVTLSGAVSKASNGATCFTLVIDNLTINGTGGIFANDNQCSSAGLPQPRGGHRGTLVS